LQGVEEVSGQKRSKKKRKITPKEEVGFSLQLVNYLADFSAFWYVQRMRSCQEHSDREGLKQQSLAKTMPVNHKHYVLPGANLILPLPKP
jgi:hypothetical protein